MAKRGLKSRDVAKDHFSSGIVLDEPKFSRLVVRFLEGKNLLASDIETGKSDPVAFVWCGPNAESPNLEEADLPESGILRTSVCPTTINPIWNEDVIFPLDVTDIKSFMDMKCLVYVRDEDLGTGEGMVTYDELGMLELPFKDIFVKGKPLKNSLVVSGTWYTLNKSPGMRKVDGSVKITLTMIFAPEDNEVIEKQLPAIEQGSNFTRSSMHQLNSTSQKVQKFLLTPPGELEAAKLDPKLRLSLTNLGRPSSAKISSRTSFTTPNIAPMVRRPSTAPQKRPEELDAAVAAAAAAAAPLEPAGRAPGRRKLVSDGEEGDEGSQASLQEGDEEDEQDEDDEQEEDEEEASGAGAGSSTALSRRSRGSQDRSRRNSQGREDDAEEELIVLSSSQYAKGAKKQPASSGGTGGIGVDVGGFDLQRLLDADNKGGDKVMQDIVTVGVNTITETMGAGALKSTNPDSEEAAKAVAEQIRATAKGLASGGSAGSLKSKSDAAKDVALLEGGPAAGDEGLLEDLVTSGVKAVTEMVRNADLDVGDALQTAGNVAAKKAKNVASAAAGAVKHVAKEQLKNAANIDVKETLQNAGKAAATAVKTVVGAQLSNVGDDLVPDVDGGRKEGGFGSAAKGAPKLAMGSVGSPRRNQHEDQEVMSPDTRAAVSQVARMINDSFAQPSGEEAYLHMMASDPMLRGPAMGDQSVDPAGAEETSPNPKPRKQKRRPDSSPDARAEAPEQQSSVVPYETAAALSAATMAHLQLQMELKQQAQGHATAVVRALKEMTTQRKIMEQSLEKIAQATAAGFTKLSERISHLEEALMHGSTGQGSSQPLLLLGPGEADQELPPGEDGEHAEEAQDESQRGRSRLNDTAPARIQGKGAGSASSAAKGKTKPGGSAGSTGKNAGPGRRSGAVSASPPPRRPQSATASRDRGASNNGDKYGNVGAIAQAKAAARAAKRKEAHPPYATFEDGPSSSAATSGFHFQPKMQLMLHGTDGRVTSSLLAEPPAPDMHMPSMPSGYPPQQPSAPALPVSRPYTGTVTPYQGPNTSNDYPYGGVGTQELYGQSNHGAGQYAANQQSYYPSPQPVSAMAFQSSAQQNMGQQAVKYPLNRDFSEVLERGSLEDIARMVESTAPRPEDLSASVRNRLYDAIATLLHQNSHTERCLIWVLALVRGPRALLAEVVGHTVRDLKEALENVALEASKRGLLASLLKSQINR